MFALLAMTLRALVPAGFMLAHADGANGRYLTIELCEGHEGPRQLANLDTGEIVSADDLLPSDGGQDEQAPCVFGGAPALEPPVLAAALVVVVTKTGAPEVRAHVRPGRGIAAPPPPSTGPPHLI